MIAPGSVRSDWMDNVLVSTAGEAEGIPECGSFQKGQIQKKKFSGKIAFFMQINKFPI